MTETPACLTYSSVISRKSVRIDLLLYALYDLFAHACDIRNAHLNSPCWEKICNTAGTQFCNREGKEVLVVGDLYKLKPRGASWHAHLAQTMYDLRYNPCEADMDVLC